MARHLAFLSLASVSLLVLPGHAAPDEKKACAEAFDASQQLRTENRLLAAREQFALCAREVCPRVVQAPCKQWLSEVEGALPSISIEARDEAGKRVPGVKILVDGKEAPTGGGALQLDPGPHTVRAEAAGYRASELPLTLAAGDRNRAVSLVLTPEPAAAPPPSAPSAAPPPPAPAPPRGAPALSFVLGGVGLVGLGAFAYLGLSGRSEQRSLEASCSPRCSPEQIDPIRRKYLLADVSLGVGVVALGAATWLALSSSPSPSSARLGVGVGPTGASLVASGGFW